MPWGSGIAASYNKAEPVDSFSTFSSCLTK
jgi:hypothetical protein